MLHISQENCPDRILPFHTGNRLCVSNPNSFFQARVKGEGSIGWKTPLASRSDVLDVNSGNIWSREENMGKQSDVSNKGLSPRNETHMVETDTQGQFDKGN